jgi:hypothetical protein
LIFACTCGEQLFNAMIKVLKIKKIDFQITLIGGFKPKRKISATFC